MDFDLSWKSEAVCRGVDPDTFFPQGEPGRHPNGYNPAKTPKTVDDAQKLIKARFCANCEVTQACLDYAIATGQRRGVWGNTTEKERKPLIIAANKSLYEHNVGIY